MPPAARTSIKIAAILSAVWLLAAETRWSEAAQDSSPRESRDPTFVRVEADGRIAIRQDGREREYVLVGVEWPDSETHRDEARDYIKRLLAGESLRVETREQKFATSKPTKEDASAATPAYIRRGPEGTLINSELIRLGFAKVAAKPAFEQLAAFREVEKRARDAGKGVWTDDAPVRPEREVRDEPDKPAEDDGRGARPKPPADTASVYITPSGNRYHLKSCQHARNGRAVSIAEALQLGKTPCSRCKPPAKP